MHRAMRLTRELVDRLPATVEDPGPMEFQAEFEANDYFQRTAKDLLSNLPADGGLWVFAYGSLIWKPRFRHVEQRRALLRGWHRAFCLGPDTRYRGNPDAPGIMLSLDEDGECEGVVFRLDPETIDADLPEFLKNEPPIPPIWTLAKTDAGPVRCIALVCPRSSVGYIGGLAHDEIADRLAKAVGMWGSMPDYLYQTVRHLEQEGIHDPYLWRMQELVADRLERLPQQEKSL